MQAGVTTGLIFYPGARVDPRSYAPAAHAIAQQGYLVVIVPMPLNLAFFGTNRVDNVIAAFPDVQHWAIGGHSLGGAFAASYVASHPDRGQGLVLWAAYPPSSADLSNTNTATSVILGSNDGVINQENLEASHTLLPRDTQWIVIEGGNHAQFGAYGPQPGDNSATISPEQQQQQIVDATVTVLQQIER
jgi:pimeloyl-ACP methyl ester carboxylesterase